MEYVCKLMVASIVKFQIQSWNRRSSWFASLPRRLSVAPNTPALAELKLSQDLLVKRYSQMCPVGSSEYLIYACLPFCSSLQRLTSPYKKLHNTVYSSQRVHFYFSSATRKGKNQVSAVESWWNFSPKLNDGWSLLYHHLSSMTIRLWPHQSYSSFKNDP